MRNSVTAKLGGLLLVAGAIVTLAARPAAAADFYLQAVAFDKLLPDGSTVAMWGYAECDSTFTTCGTPRSPGPQLIVPETEPLPAVVTVHLKNDLAVPTSVIVPAQLAALTPRKFQDSASRWRAASLTSETAPGATGTYRWNAFRHGTHLYHSGTHPQVQVQMGLLGAITFDAGASLAYASVPYDSQAVVVYSEIDPGLHAAVTLGLYGTPFYPSTFNYKPAWFLVNGEPHVAGQAPLAVGAATTRVLLRLVNGALTSRAPTLLGGTLAVVAENGNAYPYPSRGYGLLLPAGGTKDVVLVPPAAGTYPLYDRFLTLTNNQATGGGSYAFLAVGAAPAGKTAPPPAGQSVAPAQAVTQATASLGQAVVIRIAQKGMLDPRSVRVVSRPAKGGTVTNNHDGTVTYRPPTRLITQDSFRYTVQLRGTRRLVQGTVQVSVKRAAPRPGMKLGRL